MKIRAVIIEDENNSREALKNMLNLYCDNIEIVGEASDLDEGVAIINDKTPELIFLDIELKTGTGFDVLSGLNQHNFDVIFTTAFEQYAIKAIKFSSLDYLLKPIDVEELKESVYKAVAKKNNDLYKNQLEVLIGNIQQQNHKLHKLCLNTSEGVEFINVAEIIYCEANGAYTNFYLTNGNKLLVSKHLKEYESLLNEHHFYRVHNSFLINLYEVKKYVKSDGGYIIMNNDNIVNISRSKKEDFLQIMSNL
ncbi:MAG: response regulator transcription factor [Flavobacteriaceae bacterium]|nr:response regulator transcription factor [Flavobacteriaceae bacterium]